MRQSDAIKGRWRKLANEYSKSEGNDSSVDWAMAGMEAHRVKQGLDDPKGYIRRNGYGNYLKGVTESDIHRIVKESVNRVLKESKYEDGYDSGQFLCQTQIEMYGEEAAKEKIRKELEIREYWEEENRRNRRKQDPFKKGEADALADWLMSSMGAEGTTFKR